VIVVRRPFLQPEKAFFQGDKLIREQNINVVRQRALTFLDRVNGHLRVPLQQIGYLRIVVGSQMRDKHKSHSGCRRELLQHVLECLKTSCRGAHGYNGVVQGGAVQFIRIDFNRELVVLARLSFGRIDHGRIED